MAKIISCTCQSDFQDSKYGESKRVHNLGSTAFICTICGSKKPIPSGDQKKDAKLEKKLAKK